MLPVRTALPAPDSLADEEIVARVIAGERPLRRVILQRTEPELPQAPPFPAVRCDRVVKAVLERIGARA